MAVSSYVWQTGIRTRCVTKLLDRLYGDTGDFYATALSCVLVLPETDIGNSHLNRSESRSENRSEKRHTGKIAVRRIEQSLINLSFASTDFQEVKS